MSPRQQRIHAAKKPITTTEPAAGAAPAAVVAAPAVVTPYIPVGAKLRMAREKRGEGLYDVAEYLRIKPDFLHALELGQYDRLPPHAYVMGFLRSYADYLGLDGHALRELYRRELADKPKTPQLYMPQPLPEGKTPHLLIILGSLLLAVCIYAVWYFSVAHDRAVIAPPPLPVLEKTGMMLMPPGIAINGETLKPAEYNGPAARIVPLTPVSFARLPGARGASKLAKPAAARQYGARGKPARVVIKAERESWIMITDAKNATIFSRTLAVGESYHVPDGAGYHLTTGHAAGLALSLDGKPLPKIGRSGGEVRDFRLDPAALAKP